MQILMLALALVALEPPAAVPVKVVSVSAEILTATRLEDHPGSHPRTFLLVQAIGEVGSSGWSNARLVDIGVETPRGVGPSPDGHLEFKLVAVPPGEGYHLTVLSGVSAAIIGEINVIPGMLKGVRVKGQDSAATAKIAGLTAAERAARLKQGGKKD